MLLPTDEETLSTSRVDTLSYQRSARCTCTNSSNFWLRPGRTQHLVRSTACGFNRVYAAYSSADALIVVDVVVGVPYVQHQNSSLTVEFPQLVEDVEEHIPWATEALGHRPEAVNLWIGDQRAATSFHKVILFSSLASLPPCREGTTN